MTEDLNQTHTKRAYIALGSNIGDREEWLRKAVNVLRLLQGIHRVHCSPVYETEPVGYTEQRSFLNMVVSVETDLSPGQLFEHMMAIELKLERRREIHWGPRTIDLDLIMVGGLAERMETEELIIPHPRFMQRAFVLVPLLDVLERQHPDYDSLYNILQSLPDREGVKLWGTWPLQTGSEPFAN